MTSKKTANILMKYLMVIVLLLAVLPLKAQEIHADGGISVSTDSMSMNINDEKVFRIKAENCVADIDIYSSDESIAMVSHDALWLDDESFLVTVSAHKAGNCVITIDVKDAATYDDRHFTATYTIDVEVKKDLLPQEVRKDQHQLHQPREGGGQGSADDPHGRKPEEAEDQDRVKDDIEDGTGELGKHAQHGAAGGLHDALKAHFQEDAGGAHGDDAQIPGSQFCDLLIARALAVEIGL